MKKNIALLYGGSSSEREISICSAESIALVFDEMDDIDYCKVDVNDDYETLAHLQVEYCFIALHGSFGEDGRVQAVLEKAGISFSGSGSHACMLAADKSKSKSLWHEKGLPVIEDIDLNDFQHMEDIFHAREAVFVKPSCDGSSFGMSIAKNATQLQKACQHASQYQGEVMIEPFISHREYTVPILHDKVLPIIELKYQQDFYDFSCKYQGGTEYICPADNQLQRNQEIQELALQAHHALGLSGWSRIDILEDKNENLYLLEANAVPGMTKNSLMPLSAAHAGIGFTDLIQSIMYDNHCH